MRLHRTALAIATACFALACAPRLHAQAPSNPCGQVTPQQITTALGETVGEGQKINHVTCTWTANKPVHQIVTLSYNPPGDWNTRKTSPQPGISKSNVSGVGDDAIAESLANMTTLFVKNGNITFMVKVYGVPDPMKQLAIETAIAQAVASNRSAFAVFP